MTVNPLLLLREFISQERDIIVEENEFIFGDVRVPKDAPTEWRKKDATGPPYSIESLWFAYERRERKHPLYLIQARKQRIPEVSFPDKAPLFAFLRGETSTHPSIVPLEGPLALADKADVGAGATTAHVPVPAPTPTPGVAKTDAKAEATSAPTSALEREPQPGAVPMDSGEDQAQDLAAGEPRQKRRRVAAAEGVAMIVSRERQLRSRTSVMQNKKNFVSLGMVVQKLRKEDEQSGRDRYGGHGHGHRDRDRHHAGSDPRSANASRAGAVPAGAGAGSSSAAARTSARSSVPIIIVPAAASSHLNIYNAKPLLERGVFMTVDEAKSAEGISSKDLARGVLVERQKAGGVTTPYMLVSSTRNFNDRDWDRVVAVFTSGKAWQFRDWKWTNPVEIFEHTFGCHVRFEDELVDATVNKWNVKVYAVNKFKRHLDSQVMYRFWADLDAFAARVKPHLTT